MADLGGLVRDKRCGERRVEVGLGVVMVCSEWLDGEFRKVWFTCL